MTLVFAAALFGVIAGLRAFTAPAAVCWAAHLGKIDISGSWLAFLGNGWTTWTFTALAVVELVTDQLPSTPSRTVPMQFGARISTAALCGIALGLAGGAPVVAALAAIVGAVVGTLGGAQMRSRLATAFGRDLPAAIVEDVIAIAGAAALVWSL